VYGQESNYTTWRIAKINLAIRGIDARNLKELGYGGEAGLLSISVFCFNKPGAYLTFVE
jgi:hypothetical protein